MLVAGSGDPKWRGPNIGTQHFEIAESRRGREREGLTSSQPPRWNIPNATPGWMLKGIRTQYESVSGGT